MQDAMIRIKEAELFNIKNVEYGKIDFPNDNPSSNKLIRSEIIGIYGQNGSGKTAFVDAMWLIKHLISGKELPKNAGDYIFENEETATIKLVYHFNQGAHEYQIFYEVEVERTDESKAKVIRENLPYKELVDGAWKSKAGIIDYHVRNKEYVFKPVKNYRLLTSNNADIQIDLGVAKKMSEKNGTSFVFSSELEEIIKKNDAFKSYTGIILTLKHHANVNLFIIKNHHSGMINMNVLIPFSFRLLDEKKVTQGDLPIGLLKPSVVPEEVYNVVVKIIDQMNIVLETIVPGLNIGLKNHGKQLRDDGNEGIRIELISIRDDIKVPLKYESDGIKKIISILSTLITMFNNPTVCMVVDELDVGIFEYLLGEILQIVSENGKGQLIFTSHNLRPLEMLDTSSIIFTTTNPKNRYMRFANVKSNNNMRNLYYRSINLGGQKEEIYKGTNSFDISRAFRIAGRVIDEN
ncbi:AAA ATPase domain-containing protein [Anaerovirgula multivorans]|uniref:AAA ATPase domain-containing protein n=1 Tax=Anaerovirgula multivorans TaxID=312168 RepID=A0A239GJS0_9FIRM|nr:AAA family ATPase [Anaerovirgula multivorans]SNS69018.1 AAA ATPase domain-containing protein [Anaerovirgula multivorans]